MEIKRRETKEERALAQKIRRKMITKVLKNKKKYNRKDKHEKKCY